VVFGEERPRKVKQARVKKWRMSVVADGSVGKKIILKKIQVPTQIFQRG